MKTTVKLSVFIIGALLFIKCAKKETANVSTILSAPDSIGVSIIGDPYIVIPLGGALPPDQGAEVYHSSLGTFTIYATNLDKINTNMSGVQQLEYKYRDPNGFFPKDPFDPSTGGTVPLAPASRALLIPYNVDNYIQLAGTFKRTTNSSKLTITKLLEGVYLVNNFSGQAATSPLFGYQAILMQKGPGEFEFTTIGEASSLAIQIVSITPTNIKLIVLGSGFAANIREFNKM